MDSRKCGPWILRVLSLALLWWVLTGGDVGSWLFGGPVILFLASWRRGETAATGQRLRPWRLVSFVPFFFWRSFTGSCDVAWRAMHRRLPIAPAVRTIRFRLPPETPARIVYANCINMLPGTLSADWIDDDLHVHLLVDGAKPVIALRQLEDHVGLLFGYELPPYEGDGEQ